jgi:hypothetical protein
MTIDPPVRLSQGTLVLGILAAEASFTVATVVFGPVVFFNLCLSNCRRGRTDILDL